MMRARGDGGETLIEILLTIVIVGLTITALISSLATAGNAGNVQRISVEADVVMRNYAEATKAAAQKDCVLGAASYNVVYAEPTGFKVAGAGNACPSTTTHQKLTLTVTGPTGLEAKMDVKVRTP
jgi:type II secretory pathway pseudopilin PulG